MLSNDDNATKRKSCSVKIEKKLNISEIVIELNSLNPRSNKQNTFGIKSNFQDTSIL